MKNSLLNYQFFKSYRLPFSSKDNIKANIASKDRKEKESNNVEVGSMNLSGLNFITSAKFHIGENVSIKIFTSNLFSNWDFYLNGTIVRSFVDENDLNKIVYGVLLEKQGEDSVLSYFLKDFLSSFSKGRLREHLYRASTLDRKIKSTEGVELFSLFNSLTKDIQERGLKDFLTELPRSMHCESYHLYIYNDSKMKLELLQTNSDFNIIKTDKRNIIELCFEHEVLSNMSFQSSEDEQLQIQNILSLPIYNRQQKAIGVLAVTNTVSKEAFSSFSESSLRLLTQLTSNFFTDYNCKTSPHLKADHFKTYDNLIGLNRTTLEIRACLDILKNMNKSVMILGEKGTNKLELASYLHEEGKFKNSDFHYFDFENLEKVDEFFSKINDIDLNTENTVVINELHLLTHQQQNILFDLINSSKSRVITLASKELYYLVKKGTVSKKLYYLLSDIYLHLPPLRNRREDILEIAELMVKEELKRRDEDKKFFDDESIEHILNYQWPGNIKELRSEIKKSIIRGHNKAHLSFCKERKHSVTVNKENAFLANLIRSLVKQSDKSIHYQNHIESLRHFIKEKKVS